MTDHKQEFITVLTAAGLYSQVTAKKTRKNMIAELADTLIEAGFRRTSFPAADFQEGDKARLTGADWNPDMKGRTFEIVEVEDGDPVIDAGSHGKWFIMRVDGADYSAEKV